MEAIVAEDRMSQLEEIIVSTKGPLHLREFLEWQQYVKEETLAEFPDLDPEELERPFWESELLPEDAGKLLALADAADSRILLQCLADAAYGTFMRWFLSEVVWHLPVYIDAQALAHPDTCAQVVEGLRAASRDDVFLEWLANDGRTLLRKVRSSSRVRTIQELAHLVGKYKYYMSMYDNVAPDEQIGVLTEILEGLAYAP